MSDRTMEKALDALGQSIKEKERERQQGRPHTAELIQLPLWPEPARGVPNSALRGALFPAIQGKDRKPLKRELIAVQKGIQIRFTGWQLDQSDLDVWEQALHLARQHPLGTHCDFTAHAFLKVLGRSNGKAQHEWLKDVFARLDLNPKLSRLYQAGWTAIDWKERRQLRRKPLALWLHGFLASHAQPYPLKVESLLNWSGSKNKQPADFKRKLKAALDELKGVGAITGYEFSGGLVTITRTPSATQRKHLTRAKPRKK